MKTLFSSLSATVLSCIALVTGVLAPSAHAVGIQVIIDGNSVIFTDVQTSVWFATYVQQAAQAGIVSGYKDSSGHPTGKFGPSKDITLAEALKMSVEGAGYDSELFGSLVDSDLRQHWASAYVAVAKSENFAVPMSREKLDRPATRAEVSALFTAAFGIDTSKVTAVDSRYVDVKTSTTYAPSIEALSRDKVLEGDTDVHGNPVKTFRPTDPINRAEVAKMIIVARAAYGQPSKDKRPSEEALLNVVSYSSSGFSPAVLRIKSGTTVTFRNDSTEGLWVASNPHPSHSDLSIFDTLRSIGRGEIFTFTFTRLGTWGYHNHLSPRFAGTIIVE